jgi:hypothetical protein
LGGALAYAIGKAMFDAMPEDMWLHCKICDADFVPQ